MESPYDVVIVGAGHNGLVAAFYLARAGRRVLVVERRDIVGGAAVTEELWPGFRVSTGAYIGGFVDERIVDDMGLAGRGYEVIQQDPAFFAPFPNGRHLTLWNDPDRTRSEIARFSERDADAYPRYTAMLQRLGAVLKPTLTMVPPRLPPRRLRDGRRGVADWRKTLGLLRHLRGLDEGDLHDLARVLMRSAKDLLDEFFESEAVKGLLASQSVLSTHGGPYSPGTGYVLLHHALGEGSWGFVRGGMGAVSEAMAEAAREEGAEIRTGATVRRILVEDGAAHAVELEGGGGERLPARLVASGVDPHLTFLRLVGPDSLPDDFVADIRRFKMTSMVTKVNVAVSELPDFVAVPGQEIGPHHRASIEISPSMEYLERAFDDAKYGGYSRRPYIEMEIPTSVDPDMAPEGCHVLSLYCQYAAYELREGTWEEHRERYADRIIETLAEYCPNLPGSILHRQVLTPVDIERYFGMTGGNVFHGAMTPEQFFAFRPAPGWAQHRTPIDRLWLCGSGAHPGGGVRGLPGHNCAREILRST